MKSYMASESNKYMYLYVFGSTVPAIVALVTASQFGLPLQIPFIFGILLSGLIGLRLGYSWSEIESAALKAMGQSSLALLILFLIGATIGIWIAGGIIPTLIYYGFKWLSPRLFLAETCFLTFIMAFITGSDVAAFGTIGVAFLSLGVALGIPMPITVGAITAGGTAGHLISPLSDLTALAISTNGGSLSTLVKFFGRRAIPAFLIGEFFYLIYGVVWLKNTSIPDINLLNSTLQKLFVISPWLLLPVVVLFMLIKAKVPIIPALGINLMLSAGMAMLFQKVSLSSVIKVMSFGYQSDNNSLIVQALERGGVISFGNIVELILLATAWAATMERIGVLEFLLKKLMELRFLKNKIPMTGTFLGIIISIMTCAIIPAILVPSIFLKDHYLKAGLQTEHLSRDLTEGAFAAAALIPWSNLNFFVLGTLGIGAFETVPYNFFSWIILITALGVGIRNKTNIEQEGVA